MICFTKCDRQPFLLILSFLQNQKTPPNNAPPPVKEFAHQQKTINSHIYFHFLTVYISLNDKA